ncbi:hypothetical protein L6164_023958 [Bauhinia variegata]|uniref:Uncharacterized protein n=1 Tax=Bauhinia variegata TaxID=167791 RepID=A0ACB9LX00_BAUVA|nr:hypothetical protein L6164_023958 [Bauhinia variegata]
MLYGDMPRGVLNAVLHAQSASVSFTDQSLLLLWTVFSNILFSSLLDTSTCPLPGALPSTTEANPRDVKAITLRSGKTLEAVQEPTPEGEKEAEKAPKDTPEERPKPQESMEKPRSKLFPDNPPPYKPPLPFPNRFRKQKLEKQFAKFLEVFKKLHINIPFAEALEQMPSYVKFMKDILSRKLQDYETIALTEECSAILQKKLPQKLEDPGSFTIPCVIGQEYFSKALCHLGASINLMLLSVYKKLNIGEAKPTTVSLQLADRSIKYPRGDPYHPGKTILSNLESLIDVQKGNLTLRVQEEEVTFDILKALKYPADEEACFRVDLIEQYVQEVEQNSKFSEPLEACLAGMTPEEDTNIEECIQQLEATPPVFIKKLAEALGKQVD